MREAAKVTPEDQASGGHDARGYGGGRRHEDAFGDSPLLFPTRKLARFQPGGSTPFMTPDAGEPPYRGRGTVRPRLEDPLAPPLPSAKRRSTLTVREVSTTGGARDTALSKNVSV